MEFKMRFGGEEDIPVVLAFIKELAVYERMEKEVVATEATLREWMFEKQVAEVVIGEVDGEAVGFALFFHNFSTFVGRAGIYLEDLYVRPEFRGRGFGKQLIMKLAAIGLERGCGRMEWSCLNWNQSSIDFYKSLGAVAMDEWTVYRLTETRMKNLLGAEDK